MNTHQAHTLNARTAADKETTMTKHTTTTPDRQEIEERIAEEYRSVREYMYMARYPNNRTDVSYCVAMAITHNRKRIDLLRQLRDSGQYVDWTCYRWNEYIDRYGMPEC